VPREGLWLRPRAQGGCRCGDEAGRAERRTEADLPEHHPTAEGTPRVEPSFRAQPHPSPRTQLLRPQNVRTQKFLSVDQLRGEGTRVLEIIRSGLLRERERPFCCSPLPLFIPIPINSLTCIKPISQHTCARRVIFLGCFRSIPRKRQLGLPRSLFSSFSSLASLAPRNWGTAVCCGRGRAAARSKERERAAEAARLAAEKKERLQREAAAKERLEQRSVAAKEATCC